MNVLAYGRRVEAFVNVEALLVGAFVVSLIAAYCRRADARARRRYIYSALGFLAAAFIWPMIFDEWIDAWMAWSP